MRARRRLGAGDDDGHTAEAAGALLFPTPMDGATATLPGATARRGFTERALRAETYATDPRRGRQELLVRAPRRLGGGDDGHTAGAGGALLFPTPMDWATATLPGATARRGFTERALRAETHATDAPATVAALGVHDGPGALTARLIRSLAFANATRRPPITTPPTERAEGWSPGEADGAADDEETRGGALKNDTSRETRGRRSAGGGVVAESARTHLSGSRRVTESHCCFFMLVGRWVLRAGRQSGWFCVSAVGLASQIQVRRAGEKAGTL